MRITRGRAAAGLVGLLVLVLVVGTVAGITVVRRSYTTESVESRLLGLDRDAEVIRDRDGIPHIYAETAHDVFFLQGYVTAQDRLFQLELQRLTGAGRLSEVFGSAALDKDRYIRTMGWYRAAQREVAGLKAPTLAALQAYADGVNKFVDTHRDSPPAEFVLLGIRWEPWQLADSDVIGKLMSWNLSGNMDTELLRQDVVARIGPEAAAALFPSSPASVPPIVSLADGGAVVRAPAEAELRAFLGAADASGLGSNDWVVSGARTASGKPLLANDTHLGVANPSIWYLVHLVGGGLDVEGFSIPGAPGVVLGHNGRIAWGATNVLPDTQDLYVEQPNPKDLRQFRYRDGYETATVLHEEIEVKGDRPVPLDITITRHGPVMTPVLEGTKQIVAVRWTALDPGHLLDAIYELDQATDWREFRDALRDWDTPSQNLVYADVDGHIGYQMPGRIPIRAKGDGRMPVPGWTGEYEWTGYVPFDALPSSFDPPSGIIVTANQRPLADPAYPYFLGDEWDPGFRALRIHELLDGRTGLTPADMGRVQYDVKDVSVPRFVSFLGSMPTRSDEEAQAQDLLRAWDGTAETDSVATTIYQSWFHHFASRVFEDKLGADLFKDYLASGRSVALALFDLVETPDSPWFVELADPIHHGRDEMARLALDDALDELGARLGPDLTKWTWGRIHTIAFPHVLDAAPPLDRIFDIGPFPARGDGFTVSVGAYSLKDATLKQDYSVGTHPSMRFVADLSDLDRSLAIYPTGQAGQPFATHWGDLTKKYLSGKLDPLTYSKPQGNAVEGRLVFHPR